MEQPKLEERLNWQEAMELARLPAEEGDRKDTRRYMSTRTAFLPGLRSLSARARFGMPDVYDRAFGGVVYCQAAIAICRAVAEDERRRGVKPDKRLGLHSFHGYFTAFGRCHRPFIYEVSPLSPLSRSFTTLSVTARQPASPSSSSAGDHFPPADAALPRDPPCFNAIGSFKRSAPHSAGATVAEPPPQIRFATVLSSCPPEAWPPSPPLDIDEAVAMVGRDAVDPFPGADVRKVDLTAYNAGRPLHDRREIMLYRLVAPLPNDSISDEDGYAKATATTLVHAFVADRNGLVMLANHLGWGFATERFASLSYSLVFHVNADEAVMRGTGWWVQEASWPRAGAGRGIVMSKIWSPEGVHVATAYQDGVCAANEKKFEILKSGGKL